MRGETYRKILRLVSMVVVLNMTFGGFLGLMLVEDEGVAEALTIPGDDYNVIVDGLIPADSSLDLDLSLFDNSTWTLDKNITVKNGGWLNLSNGIIVFQSDTTHRFYFSVESGSHVNLINTTITVETSKDQGELFDNYEEVSWFNSSGEAGASEYKFKRLVPFNFSIKGYSSLNMTDGSSLEYEGELYIERSYVNIVDSTITSPSAPYSKHDWGIVVMIVDNSWVVFADSRVEKSPWYQGIVWCDTEDGGNFINGWNYGDNYTMYNNHTILDSTVYVINTYWDLDYRNKTTPHKWSNSDDHFPRNINADHNALNIINSKVKFYGLTIDMSETGDKIPIDGSTAIEVLDTASNVTIYRWLAVYPVDNASVPMEGAFVNVTSIWKYNVTTNSLNNLNNNIPAWEYIERVSDCTLTMDGNTIVGFTGKSGKVIFPLASDVLTESGWPNSDQFPDGYNINASYINNTSDPKIPLNWTEAYHFFQHHFPRLFPGDNFVTRMMSQFNFSAPHPELYPVWAPAPNSSELEGIFVNLSVNVWNEIVIGSGINVTDVLVQFWDGDPTDENSTPIGERSIPFIEAGTYNNTWINWNATPYGVHYIYVAVDRDFRNEFRDNRIPEINEYNNVLGPYQITVLERPDLFINSTDIYFKTEEGEVTEEIVEGTEGEINAWVHNIGGSGASNVNVSFWWGVDQSYPPPNYIGSRSISVPAGSSTLTTYAWQPPSGFYYVWIDIDKNNDIIEKDDTNNYDYNTLTVLTRPNLVPTLLFTPASPQDHGELVTVKASVSNTGGSNISQDVRVVFYDGDPNDLNSTKIGEDTIEAVFEDGEWVSIPASGFRTASVVWATEYPPLVHTIYAIVDPDDEINESNEDDNEDSQAYTVLPLPNLMIDSSDIVLSDAYPMNGTLVNVNITIHNDGESNVTDTFYVEIWLGEVGTGTLLKTIEVTDIVISMDYIWIDWNWTIATPPGYHDISVYVDSKDNVTETSDAMATDDNIASTPITIFEVPSDLIVNDTIYGTLLLDDYWDTDDPYIRDGFTLVEENGTLILKNTIFKVINQGADDVFNIVVRENGALIVEDGSLITSDGYHVNLYLFDNAKLYINGSTVDDMIDIIASGDAEIYINEQSTMEGDIYANIPNSNVFINAVNSTFTNNLQYLGSGTTVHLWGVDIAGKPADDTVITVTGMAEVYINWYLTINVVDVNWVAIEDANVTWIRSPPWSDTDNQMTDEDGKAYFWLRGMDITSAGVVKDIGSYKAKADYTYGLTTYYPDVGYNVTVEMDMNKEKTINMTTVRPELDPPLDISPEPPSTPPLAVNDYVKISTVIYNNGTNKAENVEVQFEDNVTGILYTETIAELGAGESQPVWYIWRPTVPGWHNISVWVDANDQIIEYDEDNNMAYNDSVYIEPEKPDLVITNVQHTIQGGIPLPAVEGDTIILKATVSNIGASWPSKSFNVSFSDSVLGLLGTDIVSPIGPGGSAVAQFTWTNVAEGDYTITVIVDSNFLIPESEEGNNQEDYNLEVYEYADLYPTGVGFSHASPVQDGTAVIITATIMNKAGDRATAPRPGTGEKVLVKFYDGDPGVGGTRLLGTDYVDTAIVAGASGIASIVWIADVKDVGQLEQTYDIYINVSGVMEDYLDDNERNEATWNIMVTLRADLNVDSADISFSDASPFEGDSLTIWAVINNSGGTDAGLFDVEFWDGDPSTDGRIDVVSITLGSMAETTVSTSWNTTGKGGAHEIYIVVDPPLSTGGAIPETEDELNNMASKVIVVYSLNDIIVDDNDYLPIGAEAGAEPLTFDHRGYVLVEDYGRLDLSNVLFKVLEQEDYEYNIIVRNNGVLWIADGSVLFTSGKMLRIYLYDYATLIITDSTIYSSIYEILAYSMAEIYIGGSTVSSNLKATENVYLEAIDSSLSMPFKYFGGNSIADFTGVYTPSVMLSENAELYVYKWLEAYVKDGAGGPIMGSDVTVSYQISDPRVPDQYGVTDSEGLALFAILTDIITSTTETSFLNYKIDAVYNYEGVDYTGTDNVTFTSYVENKIKNVETVEIFLSQLKPDLTLGSSDITFWKGAVERDPPTVGVNEGITVRAMIRNVGTTGSSGIYVEFYHDKNQDDVLDSSELIGYDVIEDYILPDSGTGNASITWTPEENEVGDNKHIWVVVDPMVDPDTGINELNESNNSAWTGVNVVLGPDLSVDNIRFDTDDYEDINNATEGETVTIVVRIGNREGHRSAKNINVSAYDGGELIGYQYLLGLELIGGQTTNVNITWNTAGIDTGGHIIYVYVTDSTIINGYLINDQFTYDNSKSKSFLVHPKPDLRPIIIPPYTTNVTFLRTDNTVLTQNPQISQIVRLRSTIYNDGQMFIPAVNISFYYGDPESGGVQIGTNRTISLSPNDYKNVTVDWVVDDPVGPREIFVWVNGYQEVMESRYDNNKRSDEINVSAASVDVGFIIPLKSSYKAGDTISVTAAVRYAGRTDGIPNVPYTITIYDIYDNVVGTPIPGFTDEDGDIIEELVAPDEPGEYELELIVDPGIPIPLSHDFTVEEELAPGIPWLFILILLIVAVAAVLLVGVLLARYGLGRLVECGECGAFIPEGEKKCPKCGAVFETETAKCSECGAWIPVDSKSCPECAAVFAGIEKEKKDYIERMKLQYAEYVDQYRNEAKDELGEDMTDEEFMDWWKASPKYIGFEEWLKREEELRKGKTYTCPSCNTINPESATICFKCGTVFKKEEEEEILEVGERPGIPPAEVPAKVVPKPVEPMPPAVAPTVVPKRVVKPLEGEKPPTVVPKKVVKAPPTVVPKRVVKAPPTVVPKKVVKKPPEEE